MSDASPLVNGRAAPGTWAQRSVLAAVVLVMVVAAFAVGRRSLNTSAAPPTRAWHGEMLSGPAVAFEPVISPDGQTLAFQAMVNGDTEVAVMNSGASGWRVLTNDSTRGGISSLRWAPDGTRIYFDRISHVPEGIFSVSVFGEDVRLILENALAPRPLTDGSLLVVTSSDEDRRPRLHRFWPNSIPRRLEPLGALMSTRLLDHSILPFPDEREAVFYGRPADASDAPEDLYVIDLASGHTRRLAPWLTIPSPYWKFPLAVSHDRVFFVLAAGDLHRIVAVPRRDASPDRIETTVTLSQRPLYIDVGGDGAIYADQIAQPNELLWYSPVTRQVEVRQAIGVGVASIANPSLPLRDGRVLMVQGGSGRERFMVLAPGRPPAPFIETRERTSPPVTMLGANAVALLVGNVPNRRVAIVSVSDGRIQSFVDGIDGNRVTDLAGSPDGRWIVYALEGAIWRIATAGGPPLKLHAGGQAAVDLLGQYVVIVNGQAGDIRLLRVPIDGGPAVEIPVVGEWRPAPGGLSAHGVGPNGRIIMRVASKRSWYWPLGIIDPQTGHVEVVDLGPDLDVGGGWTPDGRILAIAGPTLSNLWRFRPEAATGVK